MIKFWHGARNLYEVVCDKAEFSRKNFLPSKLGKFTKNGPKTGFFNVLKNLVINFY